ncbi:MAG: exodeoxyribonuclease VII small subunit [Deltaproteobacteria bacterium]
MSKDLNYKDALEELSQIAAAIENESITVDELATKVKRAAGLIDFCQTKLKSTDAEVKKILAQMEAKSTSPRP